MTDARHQSGEDAFADALDAIVLGEGRPDRLDSPLSRFARQLQGNQTSSETNSTEGTPKLDAATRQRIRRDLMPQQSPAQRTPQSPGSPPNTLPLNSWVAPEPSPDVRKRSSSPDAIRLISPFQIGSGAVAVVVVCVLILASFAFLMNGSGDDSRLPPVGQAPENPPAAAAATPQSMPPVASPFEASPAAFVPATGDPTDCEPNPSGMSDEQLREMSLDDWSPRSHQFPYPADPEVELEVQDTLLRYNHCLFIASQAQTPNPEIGQFESDRARYIGLYDQLGASQQAKIDALTCHDRGSQVLAQMPVPVNGNRFSFTVTDEHPPPDYDDEWTDDVPVYQIGDGRYAMVFGYVSGETFRNPAAATEHESLTFVAFTESKGVYYIDEWFTVIGSGIAPGTPPGSPSMRGTGCKL